jgi:threonine synthase
LSWSLACAVCSRPAADADATACDRCGGVLAVRYAALPQRLPSSSLRGVWRYRDWLPEAPDVAAVTLGEGATPLVRLQRWSESVGLGRAYAKLEYVQPTGSFKDRGASVLVSRARARGARRITEDSSGNAGAAVAAYAARAGLECTVFAPASTAESKLAQIRAYGAELRTVAGPREAVAAAAQAAGREDGAYYAGHNANPFFVEGCKTLAFELAEELGGAPDHVILPVGGGSLYCGLALGFEQLLDARFIAAAPRHHLVQATGCMPLVAAFDAGAAAPLPVQRRPTVAGGIEIEHPARGTVILRALRDTGGNAVAVDDCAMLDARVRLAALEGIFMEPTSAAAFAGLERLAAAGVVRPQDSAVVAVTGSGLKDPQPALA